MCVASPGSLWLWRISHHRSALFAVDRTSDAHNCTVVNVGDSRAHIITLEGVKTTKDHSLANDFVASGEIAPEDMWQHPLSNVLSPGTWRYRECHKTRFL